MTTPKKTNRKNYNSDAADINNAGKTYISKWVDGNLEYGINYGTESDWGQIGRPFMSGYVNAYNIDIMNIDTNLIFENGNVREIAYTAIYSDDTLTRENMKDRFIELRKKLRSIGKKFKIEKTEETSESTDAGLRTQVQEPV